MLRALREFFLLERAAARAEGAVAPSPPRPDAARAAEARRRSAEELVGEETDLAALVLYRDALRLALRARGKSVDDTAAESEGLAALEADLAAAPQARRDSFTRVRAALLDDPDPLALDRRPAEELAELRQDASDVFAWLDGTLSVRTVRQVKVIRALRIAGAVLSLLLVARVGWGLLAVPPNVALHKPVALTTRWPDTPEPAGLTDGDRTHLGAHTNKEDAPQMTIDLGATYRVRTLKIYNRTDCCADEILPLIVEVSAPGEPTPFVAERTQHFDVWTVDVGGKPGATVRIHTRRTGYIALSEVEVYGDR